MFQHRAEAITQRGMPDSAGRHSRGGLPGLEQLHHSIVALLPRQGQRLGKARRLQVGIRLHREQEEITPRDVGGTLMEFQWAFEAMVVVPTFIMLCRFLASVLK